jgi:uncharacterized protein
LSVYLDASVLVPVQVQEAGTEAARRFVVAAEGDICVSSLAAGEFASAMSRHVRMKSFPAEEANHRLSLFDTWLTSTTAIALDDADIRRAASFVRDFQHKLLMPDAIHVALCQRHHLTLVTLDERLAEAALALDVEAVMPK